MNPRHIEFVVATAELGSFTKAAEATHVSQPTLSQAVASIEEQIGARLFDRRGRKVYVTPAGEAFVKAARTVLRHLHALQESVRAAEGLSFEYLDIAAPDGSAAELLAELVGEFRARCPNVRLRIQTSESLHEVERLVRSGESDVGITMQPVDPPLVSHCIGRQEACVVFPPGTRLERRPVRHADLAGMPLVLPSAVFRYYGGLPALQIPSDLPQPYPAVETSARQSLIPMVVAGAGVTFLSRRLARDAETLGCVVAELEPSIGQELFLFTRPDEGSLAAHTFCEMVLARIQRARTGSEGAPSAPSSARSTER